MIAPMLCHEEPTVPTGPAWAIEQKWDGWRFLFHRTDSGVRSFAGRNGTDRTGQPRGIEALLEKALPRGTVLDAEVITLEDAGSTATASVGSVLANGGPLIAIVFDLLEVNGTDVTGLEWTERRELLEVVFESDHLQDSQIVKLSQVVLDEADHQVLHDELVARGAEGTVSKRRNSVYVHRRSKSWIKVKATSTLDCEVVGFKEGKNGHAGTLGAFNVKLLDTGVETSTGMPDDATRFAVTADPESYLGRTIELKHYGLSKDGVPKHPTFLRWREDRDLPSGQGQTPTAQLTGKSSAREVNRQPGNQATDRKEPKVATRSEPRPDRGPTKRNYGAMGAAKLTLTCRELREAVDQGVENTATKKEPTGDFAGALATVEALMKEKGL
jgi:ATP-dependent DNA ligase